MINIDESEVFGRLHAGDPTAVGQVTARVHAEGFRCHAVIRPGRSPEQRDRFADWVERTLSQLSETGNPEANGWFPSDYVSGQWYLIAHERQLPPEM